MKRGKASQSLLRAYGGSGVRTECFRFCRRRAGCSADNWDCFSGFSFEVRELWEALIAAEALPDAVWAVSDQSAGDKAREKSPQELFEQAEDAQERVRVVAEQLVAAVARFRLRKRAAGGQGHVEFSLLESADSDSLLADGMYGPYLALYVPAVVAVAGEERLPLDDVVSTLLRFNTAPAIIAALVQSDPTVLHRTVHVIIHSSPQRHQLELPRLQEPQQQQSQLVKRVVDQREMSLAAIAATSLEAALFIKEALLRELVFPSALSEVVLMMPDSDLAQFIVQLVVNDAACKWFREAIMHSEENSLIQTVPHERGQKFVSTVTALTSSGRMKKHVVDNRIRERLLAATLAGTDGLDTEALQALVALHCSGLQQEVSPDEISALFERIREKLEPRAALLFAALILSYPRLMPVVFSLDSAAAFFRICLKNPALEGYTLLLCCVAHAYQGSGSKPSQQRQDDILQVQQFQDTQMQVLANMLSDIVGFRIHVVTASVLKVFEVIRRDVLSEEKCCRLAAALPLIKPETAESTSTMTLLTIHVLLKANLFSHSSVGIGSWITKQLLAATFPVPPLFPIVIKLFLQSVGQSWRLMKQEDDDYPLIPESTIRSVLGLKSAAVCRSKAIISIPVTGATKSVRNERPQRPPFDSSEMTDSASFGNASDVLAVYYVLLANEVVAGSSRPYPLDLLWEIPIHSILAKLSSIGDRSDLETLIKKLVLLQMPFSFSESNPMCEELNKSVVETNLDKILSQLRQLMLRLPRVEEKQCVQVACSWYELFREDPWTVSMATTRILCLCPPGSRSITPEPHDLVADPLAVLCVYSPHILRYPALMTIVLEILGCVLRANRKAVQDANAEAVKIGPPDDGLAMLPLVQDSAIVQTLLELMEPVHQTLPPFPNETAMNGVRARICSFLHQMFLADPLLIKLVHFQGYDPELIPLLVREVPSLHVCLDWLPELLAQPDHHKQLFAIRLAASLVAHHRTPKSLDAASHVLRRLQQYTHGTLDAPQFLCTALPSLVPICRSFPFLTSEATELVKSIEQIISCAGGEADATDAALQDVVKTTKESLESFVKHDESQENIKEEPLSS